MTAINTFAEWIASTPIIQDTVPQDMARDALLDTLACICAGLDEPASVIVRQTISDWGAGTSSLIGATDKVSTPWAAMANATAAHALDLDDWDYTSHCHISAVLIPALLALGEQLECSGAQFLDAFIVGVEITMRIGEVVNPDHLNNGWHPTSTIGALGAAASCARLYGLDSNKSAAALSLATSMGAGSIAQFGTMAKPTHAGLAAQSGVVAASLAAAGISAAGDTLDGAWGFINLRTPSINNDFSSLKDKLGAPYAVEQHGLIKKRYACCGGIHRSIDGLRQLRAKNGLRVDDIASVIVRLPAPEANYLNVAIPDNEMQARFSIHYCLAVVLLEGSLSISDFTLEAISRPQVRALIPLIFLEPFDIEGQETNKPIGPPHTIIVNLTNGNQLEIAVEHAMGWPQEPFSEEDLASKFYEHCTPIFGVDNTKVIFSMIHNFKEMKNICALQNYLNKRGADN